MAQICKYSRLTINGGIRGTVIFSNVNSLVTFFMNGVPLSSTSYPMTLNGASFINATLNPLNASYIGFPVEFSISSIPQNSDIYVTGGGSQLRILCQPQITCDYTYNDNIGTLIKGTFSANDVNIPITFQPNGGTTSGAPYIITLNKIKFANGKSYGAYENVYTLETNEIPVQSMYINNFFCSNVDELYINEEKDMSTFRSAPWFWDLMIILFLSIVWAWFYFTIIKPRGKGFHFKFLEKKKILSSSVELPNEKNM